MTHDRQIDFCCEFEVSVQAFTFTNKRSMDVTLKVFDPESPIIPASVLSLGETGP
jgi:hypothetical protein